jgi:hypothetical protein
MYLLTIREGLQTRHIGPYVSPKQAADDLDRLLSQCSDKARWQIHLLEAPVESRSRREPKVPQEDLSSVA